MHANGDDELFPWDLSVIFKVRLGIILFLVFFLAWFCNVLYFQNDLLIYLTHWLGNVLYLKHEYLVWLNLFDIYNTHINDRYWKQNFCLTVFLQIVKYGKSLV